MSKTLYLVPTPIGNLADMTFRSVETLKQVSLILAEDTRVSGKLLKHYQINTPQLAFHEHNQIEKLPEVLKTLQKTDVALISDAGTPGISDPGYALVQAAIERDIKIVALPGPTALIPALVASGLPNHQFTFLGFLPKKVSQRQQLLASYQSSAVTLIIYESPYRLVKTLEDIHRSLGNRSICVAREISKIFESYYRLSVTQALELFSQQPVPGEIVIVIGGAEADTMIWDHKQIVQALKQELKTGVGLNQASKNISQLSGKKKSEIYELGLNLANGK